MRWYERVSASWNCGSGRVRDPLGLAALGSFAIEKKSTYQLGYDLNGGGGDAAFIAVFAHR
jgi:hypothetical protein